MQQRVPAGGLTVAGPYRNTSVSAEPVLAVGEQLRTNVTVENVGGRAGDYEVTMRVDGEVVESKTGSLVPEETTTVTLTREATTPGSYRILVGDRVVNLTVREPATPTVTGIEVPETVTAGEQITVRATVQNEKDWPGEATVPFLLDGEKRFDRTVRLPGRSELTYTATARFAEPGEHTIRVGDRTVTVTVREATETTGTVTDDPDSLAIPGFGPVAALAALVAVGGAGLLRSRFGRREE
nr:CARDB domain-containing protein [Haloarchaeobius amylolyticus]